MSELRIDPANDAMFNAAWQLARAERLAIVGCREPTKSEIAMHLAESPTLRFMGGLHEDPANIVTALRRKHEISGP